MAEASDEEEEWLQAGLGGCRAHREANRPAFQPCEVHAGLAKNSQADCTVQDGAPGPVSGFASCGLSSEGPGVLGRGGVSILAPRGLSSKTKACLLTSPPARTLCCLAEKWQLIGLLMSRRNNWK